MSGKHSFWNTFEQYVGLKFSAASPFSGKTFSVSQKTQNRLFPGFEQYAGLESQLRWEQLIQAARSRAQMALWAIWIQGYPGSTR